MFQLLLLGYWWDKRHKVPAIMLDCVSKLTVCWPLHLLADVFAKLARVASQVKGAAACLLRQ
jgi:hypothetical protein